MYKKITHSIFEEQFDTPMDLGMVTHSNVYPIHRTVGNVHHTMGNVHHIVKGTIGDYGWNDFENEPDVIKLDVPLMIRLLEWAREDSNDDYSLHELTERLIDLSTTGGVLTMENYDDIID